MIIGFAMAVPIGPIGVLCIRKTLAEGRLHGMVIGFGAATADLLYGCIAAFGLTMISDTIASQRVLLRLVGGVILLYLGVRTYRARPADPTAPVNGGGLVRSYFSTIFLTFTNPVTVLSFIAVFAALGLANGLSVSSASALVTGVCAGSWIWFLALNSGTMIFRKRMNTSGLRWVNRVAGILILLSAVLAFASLL